MPPCQRLGIRSGEVLKAWTKVMLILPVDRFFLCGRAASHVLMGVGDALHRSGQMGASLSTMRLSMSIPGTFGLPRAHLLLGTVKANMRDMEGASGKLGRVLLLDDNLFDSKGGEVAIDLEILKSEARGRQTAKRDRYKGV
uniref:Uncharacterized protein n=1 Tax=Trieres chinensis TaxID=1514140 RepID=A0A7S1ZTU4_TRICV|mmetsp:Transcript_33076/g.67509  ORF Transcript_33076/g.67509 Transcript_33076/m.67509 type:complete len:141 (+) Transcript_33076:270-692(+)